MKYRKRPLVVDAVRLVGGFLQSDDLPDWLTVALDARNNLVGSILENDSRDPVMPSVLGPGFSILMPLGLIHCRFGDWVVRDQFGHLHPYTDEDFRLIFEEAVDASKLFSGMFAIDLPGMKHGSVARAAQAKLDVVIGKFDDSVGVKRASVDMTRGLVMVYLTNGKTVEIDPLACSQEVE